MSSPAIARIPLVVINIIFLLLGFSFTVLGFVLRFGETLYKPYLEVGLTKLEEALKDTNLDNFDVSSIDIGGILTSLSICLIVGGLVLFGISMLGCCGACYQVKCMLKLYALVIALFVVGELLAIGLLYGKPDLVKDKLKSNLKDFGGIGSSEVFSLGWNVVMIQFKCCGVDSYLDFDSSPSSRWTPVSVGGSNYTLDTPIACCKTLPTSTTLDNCAVHPFQTNESNYDQGCYKTVWDLSFGKLSIAVPVLVACGIIQVLFIIFAVQIAKKNDDKVSPLKNWS